MSDVLFLELPAHRYPQVREAHCEPVLPLSLAHRRMHGAVRARRVDVDGGYGARGLVGHAVGAQFHVALGQECLESLRAALLRA
eukprot:13346540-Alexandrium_andersonii.AAC.1